MSTADREIVEAWWKDAKASFKRRDADDMIRRVLEFHEARPDLLVHLYLHEEFLFDLGAELGRRKQWSRYADLLIRLRREQPLMYEKSFGYYDRDIIEELIVTGRRAEVTGYLDLFQRFPDKQPDQLDEVIDRLAWAGWDDELLALAETVAAPLMSSPNVIGGEFAVDWLVRREFWPCLEAGDASADAANRIETSFQHWNKPMRPDYTRGDIRGRLLSGTQDPALGTPETGGNRQAGFKRLLAHAARRHFRHRCGKTWAQAEFLMDRLWLCWQWTDGKHRIDPVLLKEEALDRFLAQECRRLIWIDDVKLMATLQALALFSGYLEQRGALEPKQVRSWNRVVDDLYERGRRIVEAGALAYRLYPEAASLRY